MVSPWIADVIGRRGSHSGSGKSTSRLLLDYGGHIRLWECMSDRTSLSDLLGTSKIGQMHIQTVHCRSALYCWNIVAPLF